MDKKELDRMLDDRGFKKVTRSYKTVWLYLTLGSAVFVVAFVYFIFSGIVNWKSPKTIFCFLFCALTFLLGLWKVLHKSPYEEYIYLKGWKYKLFVKVNKLLFIVLTGLAGAICSTAVITCTIYYFVGNKSFGNRSNILIIFLICLLFWLFDGYLAYKKYSSIKIDIQEKEQTEL
ncbi:MAG: hypothetical protein LBG92_06800 [Prevotellaceae bacterium]|jgi:hypothetical protein|nr:hypothetical protein [Prevotellaceae bacterium]